MKSLSRSVRLSVQSLEDRANPSTFVYTASNRTLVVTAGNNEDIAVTQIVGKPTGYVAVTNAGGDIFRSDSGQVVRNLTVKFDKVDTGALTVTAATRLGGSLNVFGAKVTQTVTTAGTVGGNVTYTPKGGTDSWTFEGTTQIGGKADLFLGGGNDTVKFKGGFIGGALLIDGGVGADTIEILEAGDLRVNGTTRIDLGAGANTLIAKGANLFDVGKDFKYLGSEGRDTITLRKIDADSFNSTLRVGGDTNFSADRTNVPGGDNVFQFNRVTVGGNFSLLGGGAADTAIFSGPVTVGGDWSLNLRDGANYVDSNVDAVANNNRVGGTFKYNGGIGQDQVWLDGTLVGKNVDVSLGNWDGVDVLQTPGENRQFFRAGTYQPDTILGSLVLKSGVTGADLVQLHHLFVGAGLDIRTGGGSDLVGICDSDISGNTQIDLGGADDIFSCERADFDVAGNPLTGATTFGGLVTVKGGLGNDDVRLGDASANSHIQFGARVSLQGDDGEQDTLFALGADVQFLVTGNLSTFENGPDLP